MSSPTQRSAECTLPAWPRHAKEQSGKRFTPEEANLLGEEAQNRATAITGQISQVAAALGIRIVEQ